MVVEPLELCEQDPQSLGAGWNLAAGRALDGLAERKRVADRADGRNTFGDYDGVVRPRSLEAHFHPAMLEEQARLIVDDVLADIEEREFSGFQHVGSDRAERKLLDVARLDRRKVGRPFLGSRDLEFRPLM